MLRRSMASSTISHQPRRVVTSFETAKTTGEMARMRKYCFTPLGEAVEL